MVCRREGKWHYAVVVVCFGDASLPSKEKKNQILSHSCTVRERGYIVIVKSQCPLREQNVGLFPFGLWTFLLNLSNFL